jgi:hypothetical protein
MRNEQEFDYDE